MFYVKAKSILSKENGMNVFRGCSHGCIYCDSRSSCYHVHEDRPFEDIEVKENAPQLLETSLRKKRNRCMIGTGAMTDPYLPLEKKLNITRSCLELIEEYGFGLAIQTKSDLILRDLDLIKRINKKTKAVVQITLTTYDEELCKVIEPDVCTTSRRAEVLNILRDEGIPTVCWFTPILPYINDSIDNVEGIVKYCIQANTYGILQFQMGLTLRDGNRQYFYQKLDQHFPGLKERYITEYGNAYELLSPRHAQLTKIFRTRCEENHIVWNTNQIFDYLHRFEDKEAGEQMTLFDFS